MLVVDPWHWLNEDGTLPTEDRRLRKQILRVVQLIEAAATLPRLHARETTLPCSKRPSRVPCSGLVWVIKTADDRIHAHCPVCRGDEAMIDNWQATDWAQGQMEPVPVAMFAAPVLH
ncbi:MAG: hypothetical protein AAGN82_17710 [Myxococcota bacterium]